MTYNSSGFIFLITIPLSIIIIVYIVISINIFMNIKEHNLKLGAQEYFIISKNVSSLGFLLAQNVFAIFFNYLLGKIYFYL